MSDQPMADCVWTEESDGEYWNTTCGQSFCFLDGGPVDNKMKYCCYCGFALTPKPYAYEDEEEDQR